MTAITPISLSAISLTGSDNVAAGTLKTNNNMTAIAAQFAADEAAITTLQQQIGQPADVSSWSITASYIVYSGNTHLWTGVTVNSTLALGTTSATLTATVAGALHPYQTSYPTIPLSTYVYAFTYFAFNTSGGIYYNFPGIITINPTTFAQTLSSVAPALFTGGLGIVGSGSVNSSTILPSYSKFSFSKSGVGYSFYEQTCGAQICQMVINWNSSTSTLTYTSAFYAFSSSVVNSDDFSDPVFGSNFLNFQYPSGSVNDVAIPAGSSSFVACAASFGNYDQNAAPSSGASISTTFALETFSATQIVLANPGNILPVRSQYGSFPGCRIQPAHDCIGNGVFIGAYGGRQVSGSTTVVPYVVAMTVSNTDVPQQNDMLWLTGLSVQKYGGVFPINSAMAMVTFTEGAGQTLAAAVAFNPTTQRLTNQGVFITGNYASNLITNYTQYDQYNGVSLVAPASGNSWTVMFHNFNPSTNVLSSATANNISIAIGNSAATAMTLLKVRRVLPNTLLVLFKQTVAGVTTLNSSIVTLS